MDSRKTDRRKVVVFGASGHAKVVLDILARRGGYEVVGLLDDYKPIGAECLGHRVIGTLRDLRKLTSDQEDLGVIVAVGDNWNRARIVEEIRKLCPEASFVTCIHPAAEIGSDVCIGAGTVIMANAVVNSGSRIGEFCIINTRSSLDHDSALGEFASLGPAATTGGSVRIGAYSNIGIGATVLQEISIGKHTVIGAGALVLKSVPDLVVAYGSPARIIRDRKPGDRYLSEPALALTDIPDHHA